LPAYRTWSSDAINGIFIPALHLSVVQPVSTPKDHFLTQELRLASNDGGKLNWQIGALYYHNDLRNLVTARDGVSQALEYTSDTSKKTTAAGAFGEATYSFSDTWRLNAGLRYDYTKVQVNQTYTANTNLNPFLLGTPGYGLPENDVTQTLSGAAGTREFNNLTYKLRLEHDLAPQNLVYVLTSSGFSPGDLGVTTGQSGAPFSIAFNAETLTSYEIGSKNRFLDSRLQVNGSAFYYIYGAFQVANVNVSEMPGIAAFTTLSAPARAYGGELEILFQPTSADRLGLNLSYTKAYFVDRAQQAVPGSTHTFDYYFSKSDMPNVIPFRAQMNYDHGFLMPGGSRLTLHGDIRYLSAHDTVAVNQSLVALGAAPYARTGSQFVGDLNATWAFSDKRFNVSAYVRNVGDNRYKTNANVNAGVPGTYSATTELYEPRTYGLVLSANF